MANIPWAVLVICARMGAIVIIFLGALALVPKEKRVDAIPGIAEVLKAVADLFRWRK